ncbi:MAG: exodeoxyribonuclease VII large subunit [Candidatus Nanopusillus acidilobi]
MEGTVAKDNNFYKLIDADNKDRSITIYYNKPLKENINIKAHGMVEITLHRKTNGYYPRLIAISVEALTQEPVVDETCIDELNTKLKDFVPRLLSTIVKDKMKCLLIHGKNAQTQQDFLINLKTEFPEHNKYAEITTMETSLADSTLEQVIRENANNYDAIFLVRGGGDSQELERIGGVKSAIAILDSNVPFYIALGHSQDRNLSVLEKVADGIYHTPTALGIHFGKVLKDYHEKKVLEQINKDLSERIHQIEKDVEVAKVKEAQANTINERLNKVEDELIRKQKEIDTIRDELGKKQNETDILRKELIKKQDEISRLSGLTDKVQKLEKQLMAYAVGGLIVGFIIGIVISMLR